MTYVSGDNPPGDKLAAASFDLTLQGIKDTTRKTKNYTLNKMRRCSFTIYDPKENQFEIDVRIVYVQALYT